MEIWVAILGILVSAIGCYVLDRKRKGELEALRKEKADLSAKLTKAEKEKADSETQLDEARTEISSLTEQVNVANRQIDSLTDQLDKARTEISSLTEQVNVANRQIDSLTDQLDKARTEISSLTEQVNVANRQIDSLTDQLDKARTEIGSLTEQVNVANRQIDSLTDQLDKARTEIGSLTEQVNVANRQIKNLTDQLDKARTEIGSLTEQVNVANRQIKNLTTELSKVSAGNENALKLLHLFELSLQLTAFALYSEMSRAKHLGVENRKFNAAYKNLRETYEDLHAEYENIFYTYEDFREKVEQKAKRRVVQSGAGLVLSLIPGVGAIQLVADLIELADFASDISENTADFCDLLSVAELYITSSNVLEDFVDYKSIESLRPDISSDQDREKVKHEYQTVFKKVFMENLVQGNKEPDASDFNNFLKTMIQRIENLGASVPESAQRNDLKNMVDKFRQFGISSYTYHESLSMDAGRSLPVPKN